ncbi:hypothetical protein RFI_07854 [Reticulomyxa filosa]|uniref:Transmembrane protein n=1 Tax=Reticulomyxa filosa TaxID=46433 RepID=X6NTF1_RETFI|nr:hypothetical protein RFI_07854 [Reticulomyxa filosa]|eukprot:ETO29271.1 hypothetical protein RFI_07854 [Reticulomyxa filosa]
MEDLSVKKNERRILKDIINFKKQKQKQTNLNMKFKNKTKQNEQRSKKKKNFSPNNSILSKFIFLFFILGACFEVFFFVCFLLCFLFCNISSFLLSLDFLWINLMTFLPLKQFSSFQTFPNYKQPYILNIFQKKDLFEI